MQSKTCPCISSWGDAEVLQENEPNIKASQVQENEPSIKASQLQDPRDPTSKAQRPKRWVELILQPQQRALRADAKPFHPMSIALSADAKPFNPEDFAPSLDMETQHIMASQDYTGLDYTVAQEFMQQLHESLNGVSDWNMQREQKDAAPCLDVPCNTPASAFYSQDNSPCHSGATKRFAMASDEDLFH